MDKFIAILFGVAGMWWTVSWMLTDDGYRLIVATIYIVASVIYGEIIQKEI